jgi:hypothetical protein
MESDQSAYQLLDAVRELRARERDYLAAVLHDGPIQELAAATLELSLAGDDLGVPQRQVEAAGRSLRRLIDELAPLPRPGPAEPLIRRTGWLLAAPLAVDLGPGAAELSAAETETVADLVELMVFGMTGAQPPDQALAALRADSSRIVVEVTVSTAADQAEIAAWLNLLAAAMRGVAHVDLNGRRLHARMEIPRRPRA